MAARWAAVTAARWAETMDILMAEKTAVRCVEYLVASMAVPMAGTTDVGLVVRLVG